MSRAVNIRLFVAIVGISLAACAGHPVQLGIYTPRPEQEAMGMVRQKLADLGYTVERDDTTNKEIVASKPLTASGSEGDREEMKVKVAEDMTGGTKVDVTVARIIAATADKPARRVAAGAKGNADGNAIIYLFMKK